MNKLLLVMSAALLLAAGASAEPGITADRVLIGQAAGFTGPDAEAVKEMTAAAQAYFDQVNAQGGVHGRRIALESQDDGLDPKRTPAAVRKLLDEKGVFALFLSRGTRTTETAYPALEKAKIPLIGPSTGANSMYEPGHKYIFPVRGGYRDETAKIASELLEIKANKIAAVHSADAFGKEGIASLRLALKDNNLALEAVASLPAAGADVSAAVSAIANAAPDVVIVIAGPEASAAFIKQLAAAQKKLPGRRSNFESLSNNDSAAFIASLGADAPGLVFSHGLPYPSGKQGGHDAVTREFHALIKTAPGGVPSYAAMEGFLAAKVLVEGLQRAGASPTRESLIDGLESMRPFELGGVSVVYGPMVRTGSGFADLAIVGKNGTLFR